MALYNKQACSPQSTVHSSQFTVHSPQSSICRLPIADCRLQSADGTIKYFVKKCKENTDKALNCYYPSNILWEAYQNKRIFVKTKITILPGKGLFILLDNPMYVCL